MNSKGILLFFRRFLDWFLFYSRRLGHGLENYLKSKTKNFPVSPPKSRRRVVELLQKDPIFLEATAQFARETGFSQEEVLAKGKGYLKEIVSDLNYLTAPFWDLLLSWVFNKLYEGISVDEAALARLQKHVGKHPIVFVPNHRSHIDGMLLSYTLYTHRLPLLYVCAGNNMNFWPLGGFFRKSGAFYIRRRFDGNRLYQAALYTYLHYLLTEKGLIEFFIEGTRSRTGKLLPARLGILSLLIQAYQEGDIEEVLFVPTSLVYESILEEKNYVEEQEGAVKSRESFWDLFRIRKYLRSQYGKVYLRFDEPISLSNFSKERGPIDGADFIPRFANQLCYSINRSTVVTPSSLAAMALLAHPKPAITLEEIESRFNHYLEYLHRKKAPISDLVAQHPDESLRQALQKYTRARMIRRYVDEEGTFYRVAEDRRKVLDYYKNTGVHFFISAAAVASILLSATKFPVTFEEIETEVSFLKELFAYEFSFSRRRALAEHIQTVLQFFEKQEAITAGFESTYRPGMRSIWLEEFRALLTSTFPAYWAILKSLSQLRAREWEQEELVRRLRQKSRLQLIRNNFMQQESFSPFTIRNALRSYEEMGILTVRKENKEKKTHIFYKKTEGAEKETDVLSHLERYLIKV